MTYKVVLHRLDEGYSVRCPGLPGCWSEGATEEEALANIGDAIREYLAAATICPPRRASGDGKVASAGLALNPIASTFDLR